MAFRRNEEADGEPTVDAMIGGILEAQTQASTRMIADIMRGMFARG